MKNITTGFVVIEILAAITTVIMGFTGYMDGLSALVTVLFIALLVVCTLAAYTIASRNSQ